MSQLKQITNLNEKFYSKEDWFLIISILDSNISNSQKQGFLSLTKLRKNLKFKLKLLVQLDDKLYTQISKYASEIQSETWPSKKDQIQSLTKLLLKIEL